MSNEEIKLPSTSNRQFGIGFYSEEQVREIIAADRAARPVADAGEAVLWVESEPSARLLPLREIIDGMCHTVTYHTRKPATSNPVWPLFDRAAPSARMLPEGYAAKHVEGHGWIIDPPNGSRWIAFENTPAGDFMATLLASAAPAEAPSVLEQIRAMRCENPYPEDQCNLYKEGYAVARQEAAEIVARALQGKPEAAKGGDL